MNIFDAAAYFGDKTQPLNIATVGETAIKVATSTDWNGINHTLFWTAIIGLGTAIVAGLFAGLFATKFTKIYEKQKDNKKEKDNLEKELHNEISNILNNISYINLILRNSFNKSLKFEMKDISKNHKLFRESYEYTKNITGNNVRHQYMENIYLLNGLFNNINQNSEIDNFKKLKTLISIVIAEEANLKLLISYLKFITSNDTDYYNNDKIIQFSKNFLKIHNVFFKKQSTFTNIYNGLDKLKFEAYSPEYNLIKYLIQYIDEVVTSRFKLKVGSIEYSKIEDIKNQLFSKLYKISFENTIF